MSSTFSRLQPAPGAVGFACKFIGAPETATRSVTLAQATPERLAEVCAYNLAALGHMVGHCAALKIRLFRISSDIIPLASHPDVRFDWQKRFAPDLAALGQAIRKAGIRVSMHPGQYTVLCSPHAEVVARAVSDLQYHADFLDALGVDRSCKLIVHGGGVYGDRTAAMGRLVHNARTLLSEGVLQRLTLENDEKCYPIDDIVAVCTALGIPAVMDVFHHELLPPAGGSTTYWLQASAATWSAADGRQKIHYSQQQPGAKAGSHSQTIAVRRFCDFYTSLAPLTPDIMLEVKDKNLSAVKCNACVPLQAPLKILQQQWARYKYAVLEHDHNAYLGIRDYLKTSTPQALEFFERIESALAQPPSPGGTLNAAHHVWGHLAEKVTGTEKTKAMGQLAKLEQGTLSAGTVKRFFLSLAQKYQEPYLLGSLYFFLK